MPDDTVNDAGVSDLPEGYDPDTMADVVGPDAFDQSPDWMKDRFRRFSQKNHEAQQELAAERQRASALEQRMAALEGRVTEGNKPPEEKQGLDRFADGDLVAWETKANAIILAGAQNPGDAENQAELAKISPESLTLVRKEIARREARTLVNELREENAQKEQNGMKVTALQRKLLAEFGNDVLNPKSPLMQSALSEYRELGQDFADDSSGAVTYMAVQRAHAKLDKQDGRDGRGGDNAMRRLGVEGQARREASSGNLIAALRKRGDWQSKKQVQDLTLDAFLSEKFPG